MSLLESNEKKEQKLHSQENDPNERKAPTLYNLNVDFPTNRLAGNLKNILSI